MGLKSYKSVSMNTYFKLLFDTIIILICFISIGLWYMSGPIGIVIIDCVVLLPFILYCVNNMVKLIHKISLIS